MVLNRHSRSSRRWTGLSSVLALSVAAAWSGAAATAHAQSATSPTQSATPLERFQPAPAGDALFASPSPGASARLAFDAGLVFSFAHGPLVLRTLHTGAGDDTYSDAGSLVDHQAVLHAMVSAELFERLDIDIDLPLTLDQSGDSPVVNGTTYTSPSGFALNDLRLGARVTLLRPGDIVPGVALGFSVWAPTGDSGAFTSSGSARFEPRILVGADYGRVVWSASVGRGFGDPTASLTGSEVTFAAGAAVRVDRFQLGPELFGSAVVDGAAGAGELAASQRAGGGLEALLGGKAQIGPLSLGAAFGLGFLRGVGTPDYRVVAQAMIRPFEQKPPRSDTTPRVGAAQGTSPLATSGAPGRTAADGRLPVEPAVKPPEPASPGGPGETAPSDRDADGVVDSEDACPDEAGQKTRDPKTRGCPSSVRVEGTQIVILQQVLFETAKANILPSSFDLLQQVADALAEHEEIARVAVDGHTDSQGFERANLELSRARAVSVMRWLTEHGTDARRLEARGFGPRRPVADNGTEDGRAKNRRVEFQIRKRTDQGADGWIDGPVD